MHTLKGNARVFKLHSLQNETHAVEDQLQKVREGEIALSPQTVQGLRAQVDQTSPIRGALLIDVNTDSSVGPESIRPLLVESIEHVMLNGLGRQLNLLLEQAHESSLLTKVSLHDPFGVAVYDSAAQHVVPEVVSKVLASARAISEVGNPALGYTSRYVLPMINEQKCARCHGQEQNVRGAIEVTVRLPSDGGHPELAPTRVPEDGTGSDLGARAALFSKKPR